MGSEGTWANRKDTSVAPNEPAVRDVPLDLPPSEADRQELPGSDDAVATTSQVRESVIPLTRGDFSTPTVQKSPLVAHRTIVAQPVAPVTPSSALFSRESVPRSSARPQLPSHALETYAPERVSTRTF